MLWSGFVVFECFSRRPVSRFFFIFYLWRYVQSAQSKELSCGVLSINPPPLLSSQPLARNTPKPSPKLQLRPSWLMAQASVSYRRGCVFHAILPRSRCCVWRACGGSGGGGGTPPGDESGSLYTPPPNPQPPQPAPAALTRNRKCIGHVCFQSTPLSGAKPPDHWRGVGERGGGLSSC